jgi:hypothetical protein
MAKRALALATGASILIVALHGARAADGGAATNPEWAAMTPGERSLAISHPRTPEAARERTLAPTHVGSVRSSRAAPAEELSLGISVYPSRMPEESREPEPPGLRRTCPFDPLTWPGEACSPGVIGFTFAWPSERP